MDDPLPVQTLPPLRPRLVITGRTMARSRRRTPIFGITTSRREKQDKRRANRVLRRAVRQRLPDLPELLPLLRKVSNAWSFDKDGKAWARDPMPWDMRK